MNREKIRQLLKRGEWQGKVRCEWSGMQKDACPWCDGLREEGHQPGCVLVAQIRELDWEASVIAKSAQRSRARVSKGHELPTGPLAEIAEGTLQRLRDSEPERGHDDRTFVAVLVEELESAIDSDMIALGAGRAL
jgi:hypothetical protein